MLGAEQGEAARPAARTVGRAVGQRGVTGGTDQDRQWRSCGDGDGEESNGSGARPEAGRAGDRDAGEGGMPYARHLVTSMVRFMSKCGSISDIPAHILHNCLANIA